VAAATLDAMKLSCAVRVEKKVAPRSTPIQIESPLIVSRTASELVTRYTSQFSLASLQDGTLNLAVQSPTEFLIKTDTRTPKRLGLMLVGWGGNNGSTLTAALLAHKLGLEWETKRGTETADTLLGSLVMASCIPVGRDANGEEVNIPMSDLVSFVEPKDIIIGGWDINSMSIGDALLRSRVLEPDLIRQVKPHLDKLIPLASIFNPSFVASNQLGRADNVLKGNHFDQMSQICEDIKAFKLDNGLDAVIVMWTANTERFSKVPFKLSESFQQMKQTENNHDLDLSPSTIFALASIYAGCPFINGSPQNTFQPAVIELAKYHNVPIAGDDFKSGQTKVKSVLVDFLVSSGIRPKSIVSYNHLGNNDGRNLDEAAQFRSKEASKRGVVEDMVASNPILFPITATDTGKSTGPDHKVVIEYVPAVGDSKRAMDEYESEIFMGGRNTIVMHNTCEDSLLAAPLMLDLALLMEFFTRVKVRKADEDKFEPLHPVMSLLAFFLKAPLFPQSVPVVNALGRQRRAIETMLKACVGLPGTDDLSLSQRL